MDFTSFAIVKNASKTTIMALDAKDKDMHISLPVRQLEKLKGAILSGGEDAYGVVISACNVMTYAQLIQFILSCEKLSVDKLNDFFKHSRSNSSSEVLLFNKRVDYLVHSAYFSDVFSDLKIVN